MSIIVCRLLWKYSSSDDAEPFDFGERGLVERGDRLTHRDGGVDAFTQQLGALQACPSRLDHPA